MIEAALASLGLFLCMGFMVLLSVGVFVATIKIVDRWYFR